MSINDRLLDLLGLQEPEASSSNQQPEVLPDLDQEGDFVDNDQPEPTEPKTDYQVDQDDENIVYFGGSNDDPAEIERLRKAEKIRQSLQFSAPGEAMRQEFSGNSRERRTRTRPEKKEKKEDLFHDVNGKLIVNGEAYVICDCLRPLCLGCHSPCEDCHGRLCGPLCQKQRDCVVVKLEICGGDTRLNPWLIRNERL